MKTSVILLLILTTFTISAQESVNLNVTYENANIYVNPGQQGNVGITVNNPTSNVVSVSINKSLNFYSENEFGAHVSVYNPTEPVASDLCQWDYSAYSPWPSWTDGETLSIIIEDIPAMSSVTCDGEYGIGMVEGEQHDVEWSLTSRFTSEVYDTQSDTFIAGTMPQAVSVPTFQWPSILLLMALVLLSSLLFKVKTND